MICGSIYNIVNSKRDIRKTYSIISNKPKFKEIIKETLKQNDWEKDELEHLIFTWLCHTQVFEDAESLNRERKRFAQEYRPFKINEHMHAKCLHSH
jgi:hypothetical protein